MDDTESFANLLRRIEEEKRQHEVPKGVVMVGAVCAYSILDAMWTTQSGMPYISYCYEQRDSVSVTDVITNHLREGTVVVRSADKRYFLERIGKRETECPVILEELDTDGALERLKSEEMQKKLPHGVEAYLGFRAEREGFLLIREEGVPLYIPRHLGDNYEKRIWDRAEIFTSAVISDARLLNEINGVYKAVQEYQRASGRKETLELRAMTSN